MLDAFKTCNTERRNPLKSRVGDLRELIATARDERAAQSTMLTQIEVQGAKLSPLG